MPRDVRLRLDRLIESTGLNATEIDLRLALTERGVKRDTLGKYICRARKALGRPGIAGRPAGGDRYVEAAAWAWLATLEALVADAVVDLVLARMTELRAGDREGFERAKKRN